MKRSGRLSLPLPLKVSLTPGGLRETSRPPRPLRASLSLSAREDSLLSRSSRDLAKTSAMSL
ncbi:MAG: hypothetical protein L7G94_04260 [Acidilobus sp.]|nr:hypothetical protein [Acidilobus sp.]